MSNVPPPEGPSRGGPGVAFRPPAPPPDPKTQVLGLSYKTAGLLCYVPYCCCLIDVIASILWLATEPRDNRFLRFHSLQGLLLFAAVLVTSFVFRLLGVGAEATTLVGTGSGVAGAGAGLLVSLASLGVALFFLVLHIIAMIKAAQGEMWKLPIIGDIAEKNA
jgi:uncharacterized membrane protein